MKGHPMLSRALSGILGFMLLGFACVLWAWPRHEEPRPVEREVTRVRLAPVRVVTLRRTVRFSGVIRSTREATLSFAIPARVASRPVEVGDTVERGEVLAALDRNEYVHTVRTAEAAVAELKTQVEQAGRDRARMDRLAAKGAASRNEMEQVATAENRARSALEGAKARLAEARRVLSEVSLRAPFSGTITAVHLEPGEWAHPGKPVLTLSGDGDLEMRVEVPESVVVALDTEQRVAVELPFMGGRTVPGRIRSMARAATGAGKLFPVKVALEPVEGLYAGMTAELLLEVGSDRNLTVPLEAVLNPGASRPAVFCLRDGKARRVPVELGPILGDRVVLRGDLGPEDRVLITGHTTLTDGREVEVRS